MEILKHETENVPFQVYLNQIIHEWSKTLSALAFILVPIFFILDSFTMPQHLLPKFAVYRLTATLIPLSQYFIIKATKPGKSSYIHGYLVSLVVGGVVALMTIDLGGFDSRYYAGLNLVIIGVNLLLPWPAIHSAINGILLIVFYISVNLISYQRFNYDNLINNLFFMSATVIISVSINYVRHRLIRQEFSLRNELKKARDALWGEMELAKKIQTSLLPSDRRIGNYQISAKMIPAAQVGGDYYDFFETKSDEKWIAIGDVSGHGVNSGLIMMMTQIGIYSILKLFPDYPPSKIISHVNSIIREKLLKLNINRYMTLLTAQLNEDNIFVSGKHCDIMVFRNKTSEVESYTTEGTWLGIADDIEQFLVDHTIPIEIGDIILLYTDGVSEAMDKDKNLYGEKNIIESLKRHSRNNVDIIVENIISDVVEYQEAQNDDITIVIIKKIF